MTLRTVRWLACDHPSCARTFEPSHYRDVLSRQTVKGIREAAAVYGWIVTESGDDLCKHHADLHRGATIQPELFPVPDADHSV